MSANISDLLQKKYDNLIIMARKTSGDLDETKKALVTTTNMIFREGNTDMGIKHNVVNEAITPPTSKKNINTVKKQINHKHPIKK